MLDKSTINMFRAMQPPGKQSLLVELIDLFLEHSPPRLTDALKAFDDRDVQKLKYSVHTLKGSSQNLGAVDVGEICKEIETYIPNEDWNSIEVKLQLLRSTFTTSCDELRELKVKELQGNK